MKINAEAANRVVPTVSDVYVTFNCRCLSGRSLLKFDLQIEADIYNYKMIVVPYLALGYRMQCF